MIIDAHTHMPSPGTGKGNEFFDSVDKAVRYLKNAGVSAALFNMWQGVLAETAEDLETANMTALKLYKEYKGFLYPGAVVHPNFPDISKKYLDIFRADGLMLVGELVPYSCKLEFNECAWLKIFEYCAANGHAVQLHNSPAVVDVTAQFPEMQVICSHITQSRLEDLSSHENSWLDISGQVGGLKVGAIEEALLKFGEDRLFFGSDFTGYDPSAFIARLNSAVEGRETREKIYSGNIIRFMELIKSRPFF